MIEIPLPSVQRLIRILQTLPGVGPRTAQRLALHIIKMPESDARRLAEQILEVRQRVRLCEQCFALTEEQRCRFCSDPERASGQICVVEDPVNVYVIERAGVFRGHYHVLMGVLAPLQGVGPEQLKIRELMERLKSGAYQEMILALNPSVEGEATAIYLARLAKPLGIRITRLAPGIPMGADLEYLDELTLSRAFEHRVET